MITTSRLLCLLINLFKFPVLPNRLIDILSDTNWIKFGTNVHKKAKDIYNLYNTTINNVYKLTTSYPLMIDIRIMYNFLYEAKDCTLTPCKQMADV